MNNHPEYKDFREGELEELSLDSLRAAFAEFEPKTDTEVEDHPTELFDKGFVRVAECEDGEIEGDVESQTGEIEGNGYTEEFEPGDIGECFDEEMLEPEDVPFEEIAERIETSPGMILEAMLFVGDRKNVALDAEKAAGLMRNVTPEEIVEAAAELNRQYRANGSPYYIIRENDSFRMILHPDFEVMRSGFYGKTREARLTQASIDVLAIVAYRQPITADAVQQIRKSPVAGILGQLVRRELLQIERQAEGKRMTVYYTTSERFLQLFGIGSIDELPMADEMDFK